MDNSKKKIYYFRNNKMTDKKPVTLWNPNVAACLSILFAYFWCLDSCQNWENLGKDKEKMVYVICIWPDNSNIICCFI